MNEKYKFLFILVTGWCIPLTLKFGKKWGIDN